MRRVVVTGMGLASPIGHTVADVVDALRHDRTGIVTKPEWGKYAGLYTRLAGEVRGLALEYPRKAARTIGRVALLAVYATEHRSKLRPVRDTTRTCFLAVYYRFLEGI